MGRLDSCIQRRLDHHCTCSSCSITVWATQDMRLNFWIFYILLQEISIIMSNMIKNIDLLSQELQGTQCAGLHNQYFMWSWPPEGGYSLQSEEIPAHFLYIIHKNIWYTNQEICCIATTVLMLALKDLSTIIF